MKTADVDKGEIIRHDNRLWQIMDKEILGHGKAARTYRLKLKDLATGQTFDQVLRPEADLETVYAANVTLEFLYKDEDFYVFMNQQTYEEVRFAKDAIGKKGVLLKENENIQALVAEGKAISVEFPERITLTVSATPDGVKQGNKEATLENGLTILVPHIVATGDQVVIKTEDFSYVERVTLKSMSSGAMPGTSGKDKAE